MIAHERMATAAPAAVCLALALSWGVGTLGRGSWTPDEPREADIAWRMSWQDSKAVPLLAGEAFCEKPPLAYWVSATSLAIFGNSVRAARAPNLLYALITALALAGLARRAAGRLAAWTTAAAMGTLLLSYQVAIWLATDAPLRAATAVALLGMYGGFYARSVGERLRGYSCMHAALACGFLSKSAAGWMVPALALVTLTVWERRWREWLRWELYAGLLLQAAAIGTWMAFVVAAPDGIVHLKIFFWNNLIGRFAHVDASDALQYADAHRNSPGKYLLELPLYLWPWTLLVAAAVRRAWLARRTGFDALRPVRFAAAVFLPTLLVLSCAATARNIYLAPALPGVALLLGWWARECTANPTAWDIGALRGTALLLLLSVPVVAAAAVLVALDAGETPPAQTVFTAICCAGLSGSTLLAVAGAQAADKGRIARAGFALLLAYCLLLVGPASQIYRRVDAWQDLAAIGRRVHVDSADRPLVLFAPDETTRAFVDMYARTSVALIGGPIDDGAIDRLRRRLNHAPASLVLAQLPGDPIHSPLRALASRLRARGPAEPASRPSQLPAWAQTLRLAVTHDYALPNGRRYALLEAQPRITAP